MDDTSNLHIVMFPWLAMGHLLPFLELSKSLASRGHHVSYLSTPRNLQRLPKLPQNLSSLINLVHLPFPRIENLPENSQSSTDIPIKKTQLLKRAFDELQPHVANFLQTSSHTPIDWIIYDYASHWLPQLASKLHIPCVYFSLFNAATLSFIGPPWALLSAQETRPSPEAYTVVPEWIPFHSDIVFRFHEMLQYFEGAPEDDTDVSGDIPDTYRFGVAIRDCEFIAIRTCVEFEPEWVRFLSELDKKPVIPIGSLHPSVQGREDEDDEKWLVIKQWLDKEKEKSVVYVALGSESTLSQHQINELALGLERSGLPFFWVLRAPPESSEDVLTMLPNGFENRVKGRGVVWTSWVSQVQILAHRSVGGMLTHCGWNSVIEGLGFGRVLILLPMLNDQGLVARLLGGKRLGLEVPRNERDGSFTSESVTESLRLVMVDKEGEVFRNNARDMKGLFGNGNGNVMDHYLDNFVGYLKAHKRQQEVVKG